MLLKNALSVIAPIQTEAGGVIGAALVRIPTDRMWYALRDQLKIAAIITLAVLAAGFAFPSLLAKYQVRPSSSPNYMPAPSSSSASRRFSWGRCGVGPASRPYPMRTKTTKASTPAKRGDHHCQNQKPSHMGFPPDLAPSRRLWRLIFVSDRRHCYSLTFWAIRSLVGPDATGRPHGSQEPRPREGR